MGGPVLFYSIEQVPRSGEPAISLQIFNVRKSIAEALLIQTIRSLLIDMGFEHHSVRVNSLGDIDSVTRYIRELTNYLRKHINDMSAPARELMKEHVFTALMHLIEKEDDLAQKSPSPLEYLTDTSRKHFREIVEYLDMSNTPYEIDPKLIASHECYSDTLFAFDIYSGDEKVEKDNQLYIRGGRYDSFVSRMSKVTTPAAGAVVVLRDRRSPVRISYPRQRRVPSVFVVQLGFGPKIRSLLLIDELRKAGIPVLQNIVSDSLSEQLQLAHAKNTRYAVILGQKEYIEGNVILRDLYAQNQENVRVDLLASYLKKRV
jgi:histidyl-tRNA synthetase